MNAECTWLSVTAFARIFYLVIIFVILGFKGYLWTVLIISGLCFFVNLFFAVPLTIDTIRYARSFIADNEDEIPTDTNSLKSENK